MAINQNTQLLIQCIAKGDIRAAKSYCRIILDGDNSDKNQQYKARMLRMLDENQETQFLQMMPDKLKSTISAEIVGESFHINRYFISQRESALINSIENIITTSKKLQEVDIKFRNSILLYGESGTGKTSFAKILAYKTQLPLLYVNMSRIMASTMGSTGHNICDVFDYANTQPCILFFDEIDSISAARGGDGTSAKNELNRITATLLKALDELSPNVVFIGATNLPDQIDGAFARRLHLHHEIHKLNEKELKIMLCNYLNDVISCGLNEICYDEDDIDAFCKSWPTPAIAIDICNDAIVEALATSENSCISLTKAEKRIRNARRKGNS